MTIMPVISMHNQIRRNEMKKIRLNTQFLATEGIPQLLTVAMIPFTMIVYFSGWLRGGIETTICVSVFLLCTWSIGYGEWKLVHGKISKLHFAIFCASFLFINALPIKLFTMTEISSNLKIVALTMAIVPSLAIVAAYNNTIRRAEKWEEEYKERRVAQAGYKALGVVAIALLGYSAFFLVVYCWGNELSSCFGMPRIGSWQMAMHRLLEL